VLCAHGNKVLNLLRKMPETTIPVVLKRLREKNNEWQQLKGEMKRVWRAVAAKNYYRAHDFRHTLFKQADAKRLTLKNITKQIEERHAHRALLRAEQKERARRTQQHRERSEQSDAHCPTPTLPTPATADDAGGDAKAAAESAGDDEEAAERGACPPSPCQLDVEHHGERRVDSAKMDSFSTLIAGVGGVGPGGGGLGVGGQCPQQHLNGVVGGVGLIGNASHDAIIAQMAAGLAVEVGDYAADREESGGVGLDAHDYRFVVFQRDVLRDCARFVLQHANTSDVGSHRKEKRLFAEILENVFLHFFKMDISEQSAEFLQNDIDSDGAANNKDANDEDEDDDDESSASMEVISQIMRRVDCPKESAQRQQIEAMAVEGLEDGHSIAVHLEQYFEAERAADSVVIYGNRTIYALFRYLQVLYSRMNYALSLCRHPTARPLYRHSGGSGDGAVSEQRVEAKYTDFLCHLSKLINGQIDDELFEDECRRLLGIAAYPLFTVHRVIRSVYHQICDFDSDRKLHRYYRLFLAINEHRHSARQQGSGSCDERALRTKYYVLASAISSQKPIEELYCVEYHRRRTLAISLVDKYQAVDSVMDSAAATAPAVATIDSDPPPLQSTTPPITAPHQMMEQKEAMAVDEATTAEMAPPPLPPPPPNEK